MRHDADRTLCQNGAVPEPADLSGPTGKGPSSIEYQRRSVSRAASRSCCGGRYQRSILPENRTARSGRQPGLAAFEWFPAVRFGVKEPNSPAAKMQKVSSPGDVRRSPLKHTWFPCSVGAESPPGVLEPWMDAVSPQRQSVAGAVLTRRQIVAASFLGQIAFREWHSLSKSVFCIFRIGTSRSFTLLP